MDKPRISHKSGGRSIHHELREIVAKDGGGGFKLLGGVFLRVLQFIVPTEGFVFVYAQGVIGQEFDSLDLLVVLEMTSEGMEVFGCVAQAGHEDIAKPEGMVVLFEPGGSAEGLLIAAAGYAGMAVGMDFLDIEQDEVGQREEFFDMAVPYGTVGVNADVETFGFELTEEGDEFLSLNGWFTAREGDAAALAEERLHRYGLLEDILGGGRCAFPYGIDCVGVGTVEAAEGAALEEYDIAEAGTIVGAHGFVAVDVDELVGHRYTI